MAAEGVSWKTERSYCTAADRVHHILIIPRRDSRSSKATRRTSNQRQMCLVRTGPVEITRVRSFSAGMADYFVAMIVGRTWNWRILTTFVLPLTRPPIGQKCHWVEHFRQITETVRNSNARTGRPMRGSRLCPQRHPAVDVEQLSGTG